MKYLASRSCWCSGEQPYGFRPRIEIAAAYKLPPSAIAGAGTAIEFLLVNTNGGNKWTFPKGCTDSHLSHAQAAEREAAEEAGALGTIEPRHFHLYIHSKGVFWQAGGVQEFVVKAFLMEVRETRTPTSQCDPTWFSPEEAKRRLAKGREVKYARELEAVIDRALERIKFHHELWGAYPRPANARAARKRSRRQRSLAVAKSAVDHEAFSGAGYLWSLRCYVLDDCSFVRDNPSP